MFKFKDGVVEYDDDYNDEAMKVMAIKSLPSTGDDLTPTYQVETNNGMIFRVSDDEASALARIFLRRCRVTMRFEPLE